MNVITKEANIFNTLKLKVLPIRFCKVLLEIQVIDSKGDKCAGVLLMFRQTAFCILSTCRRRTKGLSLRFMPTLLSSVREWKSTQKNRLLPTRFGLLSCMVRAEF